MLALLRRQDLYPHVQTRLEHFIATRRTDPHLHPVEHVLAQAALGMAQPPHALDQALNGIPPYAKNRKRLLFALHLAVLGQGSYPPRAARLDYRGQTSWGELTGCAMKILAAHALGHPPAGEDHRFLTDRLAASRRKVWEGNIGAHTLALLALHTTDPGNRLIADGIDALLKVRNPDGGLPFIVDHTLFITSVAGLALARCALPRHRELLSRIGDYLAAHQNDDGGWAYTERVTQAAEADAESTGAALEAFHALDPTRYAHALATGHAYLAALAGEDGGFPTYLRGDPSEAVMTANAVLALAPDHHRYAPLLRHAALFLLKAQQADGTFERSWSLAQAHALRRTTAALTFVRTSVEDPLGELIDEALHRAGDYLQRAQTPTEASAIRLATPATSAAPPTPSAPPPRWASRPGPARRSPTCSLTSDPTAVSTPGPNRSPPAPFPTTTPPTPQSSS
ncbi:prenyltransferase/squalene oxidase repeat-containing protein [Nonomuraea jabiensis]|uniref:prenyltransferase/squalene oxidase repeat-containing protein n=1 Tax=Nonomuraea jabiensis TaxID=882448 RepID=UPI003D73EF3A